MLFAFALFGLELSGSLGGDHGSSRSVRQRQDRDLSLWVCYNSWRTRGLDKTLQHFEKVKREGRLGNCNYDQLTYSNFRYMVLKYNKAWLHMIQLYALTCSVPRRQLHLAALPALRPLEALFCQFEENLIKMGRDDRDNPTQI